MYQSDLNVQIKLATVPSENWLCIIIMTVLKASIPKVTCKIMDIRFAVSNEIIFVQSNKINLASRVQSQNTKQQNI